jgi:dolichyl-phosphate-mannose-protein mannosyltransferase
VSPLACLTSARQDGDSAMDMTTPDNPAPTDAGNPAAAPAPATTEAPVPGPAGVPPPASGTVAGAAPAPGSPTGPSAASRPFDSVRFAITALCIGFICLGALWRLVDLDYPRTFSFDEHHFVRNARNYIIGQADWNDHPPLGKLVLVPAMKVFGDRGLGWRLSSACFGLAMVGLIGLIAGRIFRDRTVGLLAAAFVAVDGFFLSYARTALIDNPLTAFIYGALALMLWARSLTWFAGAAVCVGLAVSSKWTGVCVLLLAPILLRKKGHSIFHTAWMFAVAAAVYVVVGATALKLTHQPIAFAGMMRTNWDLLQHHAGFTVWDNAGSSKWYTWPLLTHPLVMHFERVGPNAVRATSTIGNLLLWFGTTASVVLALGGLLRALWRWARARAPIAPEHGREALVLAGMIALMLPFILTHRQSYIFHYLGAYGLGLGLLASRLARLEKRSSAAVLGFLVCTAVVSFIYLPLWTGGLLTLHGFELRLPFPGWR